LALRRRAAKEKELEVEELKLDHYNKVHNVRSTAGGKGINVSKAIKSCQRDTVTLGFVGGNRGRINKVIKSFS